MKVLNENQGHNEALESIHGGINFTGPDRDAPNRDRSKCGRLGAIAGAISLALTRNPRAARDAAVQATAACEAAKRL